MDAHLAGRIGNAALNRYTTMPESSHRLLKARREVGKTIREEIISRWTDEPPNAGGGFPDL